MKKKRLISLLSSIFSSVAVVGLFCLCCFSNVRDKDNFEVSASMSLNNLTNSDVTFVTEDINTFYPSMYTYLSNNMGDYDIVTNMYYDFDYAVNGYVNGNLFEKIRVRVNFVPFSSDNVYYTTSINFYYGSNNDFSRWDNPPPGVSYTPYTCVSYTYSNFRISGNFQIISDNVYGYSLYSSTINFVNGDDISNVDLLYLLNLCCTYKGMNTYSVDNLTASQYEDMIKDLNYEIDGLQNQIDSLTTQVDNSYYSGYYDAKQYYEQEYNNNMQAQYQLGYDAGFNEGFNVDTTATTIFSGILTVAMVPVNFFLSIFNFEILGINLSYFVRALFTVMLVLIVVKLVVGNLGGDK